MNLVVLTGGKFLEAVLAGKAFCGGFMLLQMLDKAFESNAVAYIAASIAGISSSADFGFN